MIQNKNIRLVLIFVILLFLFFSLIVFNPEDFLSKDNDVIENINTKIEEIDESEIVEMINMVDKKTVYRYLTEIVDMGPKPTGSDACDQTAEYLYDNFKKMGLSVEYQDWSFPFRKGRNVVATHPGIDSDSDFVFIVCAHYDTWPGAPGANDDASGVAVMLTIAEIMSCYSFNHTMRFVGFSGHENGPSYAYGSSAYARYAYEENDNIVGVLNLDMIGNTTDEGNVIQMHGLMRSSWLFDFIDDINNEYSDFFDMTIESFYSCPGADEASFIDYGFDAVLFIQSNFWESHIYPNHCPEDDLSTVDFDFLTNATRLILASAVELADKQIDLHVRIIYPMEGYVYFFDKPVFHLPGFLNLRNFGLRGMTYIIGNGISVKLDIDSDDEVKSVFFIVDDKVTSRKVVTEPPFEFKIEKRGGIRHVLRGKHKIGVKVVTYGGGTVYDEMDVFFIP